MYLLNEVPQHLNTKEHLGGKGWGLVWMTEQGVNVPPAIIIPTTQCKNFQMLGLHGKEELCRQLADEVLVKAGGKLFTKDNPCVSVRSGARVSMPGMMDTILNVGITPETWDDLEAAIGEQAALDSYRRLIEMFGVTVRGHEKTAYSEAHAEVVGMGGGPHALTVEFLEVYSHQEADGAPEFPDTIHDQLWQSIYAVFSSWGSERAREYRKLHSIPDDWGTAVIVQAMVFGNRDDNSCSGVMFSRDPATGDSAVIGEYAVNAQGEDVVSGAVTPRNMEQLLTDNPDLYWELIHAAAKLEKAAGDAQDIEFTVQSGVLYILQTRTAKRTFAAHVRIAHDLCLESILDPLAALRRIPHEIVPALSVATVAGGQTPTYTGLAAGGGAVVGVACFNRQQLQDANGSGILIAPETTPEDFPEMILASAILTSTGGITCHAAVVARGMNKTCVVGCQGVMDIPAGATITVCGTTGEVYMGKAELQVGLGLIHLIQLLNLAKEAHPELFTAPVIGLDSSLGSVFTLVPSCWQAQESGYGMLSLDKEALSPEGGFLMGMFNGAGHVKEVMPATIQELMQLTAESGVLSPSYVYTVLGGYDVLAKLQGSGLVNKNLAQPARYLDEALGGLLG